jgi:hypothetical protein
VAHRFDKHFAAVRNNVAEFGVHIQWIFDTEPSFAYTVGMAGNNNPEFIVFNVTQEMAAWLLNNLALRVRDGVQDFEPDTLVDGLLTGFSLYLMPVEDSSEHLTLSNRFYRVPGRNPVRAVQVVQPGVNGLWPWEPGCDIPQPLLGAQPADISAVRHVHLVPHDPTAT